MSLDTAMMMLQLLPPSDRTRPSRPSFDTAAACRLIDIRTDRGMWKTALHEAGHAILALLYARHRVLSIELSPADPTALGLMSSHVPTPEGIRGSLADRILVDVAGAVAEELVLGAADGGISTDLRTAFARAGCLRVDLAKPDDETVKMVRDQVQRARVLLTPLRGAILTLADELMAKGWLSIFDIACVLRGCGVAVPVPQFDGGAEPDEAARLAHLRDDMKHDDMRKVADDMLEESRARKATAPT